MITSSVPKVSFRTLSSDKEICDMADDVPDEVGKERLGTGRQRYKIEATMFQILIINKK